MCFHTQLTLFTVLTINCCNPFVQYLLNDNGHAFLKKMYHMRV